MAKISSNTVANQALVGATNTTGIKTAVHTLPLETVIVKHDNSIKGDRPKVTMISALRSATVGTVSIFAPNYLSFNEQRAFLMDLFEHGDSFDGSLFQPTGSVDDLYFERYGEDSPTFEVMTVKAALKRMEITGLNSAPIEFGIPNARMSRADIQTANDLQRGNYGKVAVKTNSVGDILKGIFS
jgi:hypothetical protein